MRRSACLLAAILSILALGAQALGQKDPPTTVQAVLDPISAGESSITLTAPDEAAAGWTIAIYSATASSKPASKAAKAVAEEAAKSQRNPPSALSSKIIAAKPIPPVCDTRSTSMPLQPDTSNVLLAGAKTTVRLKDKTAEGQTLCAFVTSPPAPASAQRSVPGLSAQSPAAAIAAAATDAATRAAIAAVEAAKPEDVPATTKMAAQIAAAVAAAAVQAAIADSPVPGHSSVVEPAFAPNAVPAPAAPLPAKAKKPTVASRSPAMTVVRPPINAPAKRLTQEAAPAPMAEAVVRPAFAKIPIIAASHNVSYETSSLVDPAEGTVKTALVAGNAGGSGGAADPLTAVTPTPVTVSSQTAPPGFDWGLVRAYFTLGALTSQERDQFSHQDLLLSFHLDKAYTGISVDSMTGYYGHRPTLNSFFETRLTAIPVAVQNCTPTAATANTPAVTCANQSSGSGATTDPATSQAFLNSQKSARLQFGVYTPILLKSWSVDSPKSASTSYALFIAPLVKTGFDTTLNGLNQTQQASGTSGTVQAIGGSNQFYKFYDFGFRLGHYKLPPVRFTDDGYLTDPVAPETLSYLDVSFGRFSNLASLLCPTADYTGNNTCSATAGTLAYARDARLNVEGLLEVPATKGFSIGFSTNVAFDPFRRQGSSSIHHIRPADDLRFLFAYKFDISSIAAKLAPGFRSDSK